MTITDLEQRIDSVLDRRRARAVSQHAEIMQEMTRRTEEEQRFDRWAHSLYGTVIEPRLKVLAERTGASRYARAGARPEGAVRTNLDRKVSASIELAVDVRWISGTQAAIVCTRTVLPILIEFARDVTLSVEVESVSEGDVARFVEDGIVDFVELVSRVEADPRYSRDATEIDPVCGMRIHRADASGSATHDGETYYFCVATCRDRFLTRPDHYTHRTAGHTGNSTAGHKVS